MDSDISSCVALLSFRLTVVHINKRDDGVTPQLMQQMTVTKVPTYTQLGITSENCEALSLIKICPMFACNLFKSLAAKQATGHRNMQALLHRQSI